jgi:hypothetical protein
MIAQVRNGMLDLPYDCCRVAMDQLYLCEGNDPTAKIEACPFMQTGEVDLDVARRLLELYEEQNPPP